MRTIPQKQVLLRNHGFIPLIAHHRSKTSRAASPGQLAFPSKNASRCGGTTAIFAGILGCGVLFGAVLLHVASGNSLADFFNSDPKLEFITAEVENAQFEYRVLERGEVASSSNTELRCQVRSRNSSGVNILEIVPEGKWVEAEEIVVRLDDSALQTELIQQQIIYSNSESAAIEAKATLEGAQLSLEEYEEGTFIEAEEQQESAVFVARENLRRSEEYLKYSKRLAARGYIPAAQLDADSFAVDKANKELGVSRTKLTVLQTFTRTKMINQLTADIQTAAAKLKSREKTHQLDEKRLGEIEVQIERCTIFAPVAGEVVYANDQDRRGSSGDLLIAEGRPVRERQVIVRLPDPTQMRVVTKVHESRISHIKPGLVADIVLDSMADGKLRGVVKSVSEYPLPSISVYMSHIKEYAVEIDIIDPPEGLRPGMTAKVSVLVTQLDAAIQIPIQAVVGRSGRFFCAIPQDGGVIGTREITTGKSNEEQIIVLSGLETGEHVILNVQNEVIIKALDLPNDDQQQPKSQQADDSPPTNSKSDGRTSKTPKKSGK